MKTILNRTELLSAVKRGESIAPRNPPLDVLKGLLWEMDSGSGVLTLTATNMEITLEQKIPCRDLGEDAFVLNARLAVSMLEKLPGDTVELERNYYRPQLHLRSGSAQYLVPIWERDSYPKLELPFPEDTVKVSGIPSMAKRTVFAAAQDDSKPLMKCVNLEFTKDGLRAVGSNGNCIVTAKGDESSTENTSLLVPAASLVKLAQLCGDKDEFHVGTTGKSIVFLKENFIFSARLLEGDYIDAEGLIGRIQNPFTVLTGISELRAALESASSVDVEGSVCLRFEGSRITFCCQGGEGSAAVPLEVIPLTGMPQGEYWYLSRQLLSCLKALSGTVKLGVAQGGMLTLEAEDAYYLQTGIRPGGSAGKKPKKPAEKAA